MFFVRVGPFEFWRVEQHYWVVILDLVAKFGVNFTLPFKPVFIF